MTTAAASKPKPLRRATPSISGILFGFPLRSKALFFRQLATMVNAAVSISQGVRTAGTHTFPKLTEEMANLVDQGYPLSQVLARYPHYFSDYEVAAVRTGEYAGSLDNQLGLLATEMEKTYQLKQNLTSKLFYPALVGHCAIFIPPLVLLVTQGLSAYLKVTLGILIPAYVVGFLLYAGYKVSAQSGVFRSALDTVAYYIPIVGTSVRLMATTRFLRVLGHLHEAGMLPDKALSIACQTCGNQHVASAIKGAFTRLGDTVPTSKVLNASGVFPSIVCQMMSTGEETGQTGRLLNKMADMTEQDMQVSLHRIVTVLPILMLLGVGAVVGYQVINTFSGMAKMIQF